MHSLVLPSPVRPAPAIVRRAVTGLRPLPWPHPPASMAGTPYYDDELDMAQSTAHMQTIFYLGSLLNDVAAAANLRVVSDNPVWYWLPEKGVQRALYPDYALTANPSTARLTAPELLLALEVVSTADAEKEEKDTVVMRDRNAAHGVREFVLIYPEPDDIRSVVWYVDEERTGQYQVVPRPANGRYRSVAIDGLELEVLPRDEWTPGRKVRVWFQGQEMHDRRTEVRLRQVAEQQADQERAAREQEQAAREQEHQARLVAEQQAAQERAARDQEYQTRLVAEQQAAQERAARKQEQERAEQERARAAQLAERLRALGIDPDTV